MAFHFPLMTRMFMAIRLEDRGPLTDIIRRTPTLPENCQWAVFLRNHDELTLEMVTPEEREFMYDEYARDPVARLNLGIRRRLAPLLDGDRRRVELMNGLLMSLPGSPIVYYGDEIGMGDNVYLGDRNGVRTPMQWSGGWNGGFSTADPGTPRLRDDLQPRLRLPGRERAGAGAEQSHAAQLDAAPDPRAPVHARVQPRQPDAARAAEPAGARLRARLREGTGAGGQQPVRHRAGGGARSVAARRRHPVEMFGQSLFPRIGTQPYLLTLGPHAFYWFRLRRI
jgi:maltose alpha-D-glucosyltransferase/alpha-amylase